MTVTTQQALDIARKHHAAGQLQEAEAIYRQILSQEPSNFQALHLIGLVAYQVGQPQVALDLIGRAISIQPSYAEAYNDMGVIFSSLQRDADAMAAFQQALQLRPNYREARDALDLLQRRFSSKPAELPAPVHVKPQAEELIEEAIKQSQAGNQEQALQSAQKAVELLPDQPAAHQTLATVFQQQGNLEKAITSLQEAIRLSPQTSQWHDQLAELFRKTGKLTEAIASLREVIRLQPDFYQAHCNLGRLLLKTGQWHEGWAEMEYRRKIPEYQAQHPNLPGSEWDGGKLRGRTILLYTDGSDSDTLQFIRLTRQVTDLGGRVVIMCPPSMTQLLKTAPGVARICPTSPKPLPHDVHLPINSLPYVLKTRLHNTPQDIPYILADRGRIDFWNDKLRPLHAKTKIGLRWAGSAACGQDRQRSIPIASFQPMAKVKGIGLVSLQKGGDARWNADAPQGLLGLEHTAEFKNYSDTAALISHLDLVITVDTVIAHLAGAMGRPVWVLLPWDSDWRWLENRNDSPWYPTMQLLRQPKSGDWESVLVKLTRGLQSKAREL